MADSTVQTGLDILSRYTNNTKTDFDPTVNRGELQEKLEQEQKDKSTLSFTDMLSLMVAQFQNQTIDNQADTSDMMNQLVQMSSMQAMTEMTTQIKELTLANVMAYSASLVGQTVTVGVYDADGKLQEVVGVVQGTGTYDGQQVIYLENGEGYFLSEIMAVGTLPPKAEEKPDPDEDGDVSDKVDQTPGAGDGDKGEGEDTDEKVDETQGTEGA